MIMDRFQAMKVFTRVAEVGSFSRAADMLEIPKASATIIIQQLEAYLDIRLLQRTTRRLSLTPDGAAYYEHCVRLLSDLDAMESSFHVNVRQPRGKLRLDIPAVLGRVLIMPALFEFQKRYPEIELMVGMSDKPIDLIQESVDCVIRVGELQDSSLVARRLGDHHMVTVASPAYLERCGTPQTLADLQHHSAINYFWGRTGRIMDLTFVVDGRPVLVKMRGKIAVNDTAVYLSGCLRGVCTAQTPIRLTATHLRNSEAVEVLPQHKPLSLPISAVYPHNRHLSPTLRVFVDWAVDLFDNNALLYGRAGDA